MKQGVAARLRVREDAFKGGEAWLDRRGCGAHRARIYVLDNATYTQHVMEGDKGNESARR